MLTMCEELAQGMEWASLLFLLYSTFHIKILSELLTTQRAL